MHTLATTSLLLAAATALAGCPTHVLSPPSQFLPLESPAPLAAGETWLGAEGGVGGAVFGPDVATGAVVARRGLTDTLELRADATLASILANGRADTSPWIGSGRVGVKALFAPSFPHLAWTAGLGGGTSAGGAFATADLGVIVGYENPIIVPFLSVAGLVSVPLTRHEVDITRADAEPGDPAVLDTPNTTLGARVGFGVRVPVEGADLSVGAAFLFLADATRDEDLGFTGASASLGARF